MLDLVFLLLLFGDYRQTLDIKNHPGYSEINPILGKHPSDARIRNYFLAAGAVYGVASYALPDEYRPVLQWGGIALESVVLLHNNRIGLRITF